MKANFYPLRETNVGNSRTDNGIEQPREAIVPTHLAACIKRSWAPPKAIKVSNEKTC